MGDVEAIIVAAPPMAHYDLTKQALDLGKHVLTEKPFAMSVAQGADLVETSRAGNRQLAIVHNFQFARSTHRLMADIASDRLGAVTGIDAVQFGNPARRLPEWYEQLPLGLFYDESPHLLYLMRAVAGELTLKQAMALPGSDGARTPARIEAWFEAPLGCPIRLGCNFESPVSEWYLMVCGRKALGIVDVFRDIYIRLPNDGAHDTRSVMRTSIAATFQHWIQHVTSGIPHLTGRLFYGNDEVFGRFADAIDGKPRALEPISGLRALEILKLQHAIVHACHDFAPA
jgi:scyllo-inositol 2-dehydrogenase (NADP+)